MPQILLVHPVHGSKFALSEPEVELDEKQGWERYTEPTPIEAAPKRKYVRKVAEPSSEQPNDEPVASVSDESEGN